MNPLQQEGLLLRQLGALREQGIPADQALAIAGPPSSPLGPRVARARRILAAGTGRDEEMDPLVRLLASPTATTQSLDLAARAADARFSADEGLAELRFQLGLAVAVSFVLGLCFLFAVPDAAGFTDGADGPSWGTTLARVFQLLSLPLAIGGCWLAARLPARWSPGITGYLAAGALLETVAHGGDPLPLLQDPWEQRYLAARGPVVGVQGAVDELVSERVRRAETARLLVHGFLPVVTLILGGSIVAVVLVSRYSALFSMGEALG